MTDLIEFRLTVSQRYPSEQHPTLPGISRDNWVAVFVATHIQARRLAFDHLGNDWLSVYRPDDYNYPTTECYPLGEFAQLRDAWLVVPSNPLPDETKDPGR